MKFMKKKTINIAKDFSRYPYGRLREFSKTSGEVFREDYLVPALNKFDVVEIELDGTEGYGSSFLDESFAGLIRTTSFSKDDIQQRITFISNDDPSLIDEIKDYIKEA